uniref:Uncharacterized protein n=1 Tax=Tanacetum cinerariifolium TaxID=118510 RepID=A0A6L2LF63_TANCI|nr:hypothetical protein [Tanacetum cinerariifolium]
MDQQNLTLAKIPIMDTRKFEQWQFRIQQYLQHEHYALWKVIEFGDCYEVPASTSSTTTTDTTSDGTAKRSETLEQTFNRLQVIVGQLQFMDVEIEQDDLNHKLLTSLAPDWLMHRILWRNRSDLDTMSLDDLYNHLKSLLRSFDQKKNNIQVQQSLLSWPSQAQVQIKRGLERDVEVRNNKIEYLMNELEQVKKEKEGLDIKLTGFKSASKDLDTLFGSQRTDKNKEGLPEFVDDTVTDYSRLTPSIDSSKSNTSDLQNSNFSVSEHGESSGSIMSKPMIKFVKAADYPRVIKTKNTKNAKKSTVKYAEMYLSKSPKVKGNQRTKLEDSVRLNSPEDKKEQS